MTKKKQPTIVDELRTAIAESGQSVNAMSKEVGIDQSNLNHFANGSRGISLEAAARLCTHLDLHLVKRRARR